MVRFLQNICYNDLKFGNNLSEQIVQFDWNPICSHYTAQNYITMVKSPRQRFIPV